MYQIWFRGSSRGHNQLRRFFVAIGPGVSILYGVVKPVAVNTVSAGRYHTASDECKTKTSGQEGTPVQLVFLHVTAESSSALSS